LKFLLKKNSTKKKKGKKKFGVAPATPLAPWRWLATPHPDIHLDCNTLLLRDGFRDLTKTRTVAARSNANKLISCLFIFKKARIVCYFNKLGEPMNVMLSPMEKSIN
jgi:hypothetical protein